MKNVIIPIDFSEASDVAVQYALKVAEAMNCKITIAHFYHPSPVSIDGTMYVDESLEVKYKEELERYVGQLSSQFDIDVVAMFDIGLAGDEIVKLSNEDATLIIMGSTGSSDNVKTLFGSVSTRVAQNAHCPVLIVPKTAEFTHIDHIAYCSDDISLDASTFHKVISVAEVFDSTISLVHIHNKNEYNGGQIFSLWKDFYPEEKLGFYYLDGVDKMDAINNFCTEKSVSLMAMSTKERGILAGLFHRSFTKQMVINSHIPILVTHRIES